MLLLLGVLVLDGGMADEGLVGSVEDEGGDVSGGSVVASRRRSLLGKRETRVDGCRTYPGTSGTM